MKLDIFRGCTINTVNKEKTEKSEISVLPEMHQISMDQLHLGTGLSHLFIQDLEAFYAHLRNKQGFF